MKYLNQEEVGFLKFNMQQIPIAHKLWITNIIDNNFYRGEDEFDPGYIIVNNESISKTNIIGTVIDSFRNDDGFYATLTVDDSSATIKIKTFSRDTQILNDLNKGDLVLIVGKIREYQNEVYILPDFIKKLSDLNWDLLRKIELIKSLGKLNKKSEKLTQKPADRIMVFNLIKNKGDPGMTVDEIIQNINLSKEELELLLNKLIEDGEIYQDKPNNFKVI